MPAGMEKSRDASRKKRTASSAGLCAGSLFLLSIITIFLSAGCKQTAPVGTSIPPTTMSAAPSNAGATTNDLASADPTAPIQNSLGMWLAPVDPGEFVMGSPADEPGRDTDETQHTVRITRPFWLGVYPVTQGQYAALTNSHPSYFQGGDDLPVESVSWDEAVAFCKKLSAKEGKTYRLPTEAEREYACRAGSTGPYAGDGKIDDIGWYLGNSGEMTHPVGSLQPNDWGFYDMQGNVWEWCSDWYGPYPQNEVTDPIGPKTGTSRVLRGGSLEYGPEYARSAFRNYYSPDAKLYYIGFRVVMESP